MPPRGLARSSARRRFFLPAAALAAALAGPSQAAEKRVAPPPQAARSRPVDMGKMLRQELGPMIQKAARLREAPIVAILDLEAFALAPAAQPREAARAAAARLVLGALADPARLDAEPLPLEATQELAQQASLRHSALLLREQAQREGGNTGGKPSVSEALARLETAYARGLGLAEQTALLQAAYDGWVERWSHVWFNDEGMGPLRTYLLEKPAQPETRIEKELHVPGGHVLLDSPEDFGPEERHTAAVAFDQAAESLRDPLNVSWSVVFAWAAGLAPILLSFLPSLPMVASDSEVVPAFLAWSVANLAAWLLSWRSLHRQAANIEALASGRQGRLSVGEALGELYQLQDRADKARWVTWSAALTLALAGAGPRLGLWLLEQAWPLVRFPAWPYGVALAALLAGILAAGSLLARGLSLRRIERMAEAAIEKLRAP